MDTCRICKTEPESVVNWWFGGSTASIHRDGYCNSCVAEEPTASTMADLGLFADMFGPNAWARIEPLVIARTSDEMDCAIECFVIMLSTYAKRLERAQCEWPVARAA